MNITDTTYFDNLIGVKLSSPIKTSSLFVRYVDTKDTEIGNIFNNIKPTKMVPFVSWNGMYKIYKDFIPSSESWINNSNDHIYVKYIKTVNADIPNDYVYDPDYDVYFGDSEISFFKTQFVISFTHEVHKLYIEKWTDIFDNISDSVGYKLINEFEKDISSMFDILNQDLQLYIFKEMLTNDEIFGKYLTTDESYQTKKSYLTVRFRPQIGSTFTFTITQNYDNNVDNIRIKLKGFQSQSILSTFRSDISKLFTHYNNEKEKIKTLYELYDVVDTVKVLQRPVSDEPLQTKTGQTRQCPKERQPQNFASEELARNELGLLTTDNLGGKIMNIPDKDGVKNYYICNKNGDFLFPGVRVLDEETLLKCCYKKQQIDKPNSSYTKYITKNTSPSKITTPHILSGNKILEENQQGFLPDNLKITFGKFLKNQKEVFLRYGVKNTKRSLLDCLSKALSSGIIPDEYGPNAWLAKQEMYDYTLNEIKTIISDDDAYIDPRLFCTLIGEIEKVNIFMFDKNGMIKPRYHNGYYKRSNNYNSVIIFENAKPGDTSRWEIIALTEEKRQEFEFSHDHEISVALRDMLYNLTSTNVNNTRLPQYFDLDIPSDWKLTGQMFDTYGKTRIIRVMTNQNIELTFKTTPIQPLSNCPEIIVSYIEKYSKMQYNLLSKISNQKTTIANGELLIYVQNVVLSVPINEENIIRWNNEDNSLDSLTESISNISVVANEVRVIPPPSPSVSRENIAFPTTEYSDLNDYVKNKRKMRYFMEYVLWAFAKYGNVNNIPEFMERNIQVDNLYTYNFNDLKFSETDNIIKNNKIIINNINLKPRIEYIIKIYADRNPEIFDKYKDMKFIPKYFKDITDFKFNIDERSKHVYISHLLTYFKDKKINTNTPEVMSTIEEYCIKNSIPITTIRPAIQAYNEPSIALKLNRYTNVYQGKNMMNYITEQKTN